MRLLGLDLASHLDSVSFLLTDFMTHSRRSLSFGSLWSYLRAMKEAKIKNLSEIIKPMGWPLDMPNFLKENLGNNSRGSRCNWYSTWGHFLEIDLVSCIWLFGVRYIISLGWSAQLFLRTIPVNGYRDLLVTLRAWEKNCVVSPFFSSQILYQLLSSDMLSMLVWKCRLS